MNALICTAIGDSLGLPREGLSVKKAAKKFGGSPINHRLLFGKGMISDDTEHSLMTAQALIFSAGDPDKFGKNLAWRLKGWLIAAPAGVGLATLRSIIKLILGYSYEKSGVYSAGNGPAMRASVIGIYANNDIDLIIKLNRISTKITHTDPKAEEGSLLIALAAAYSFSNKAKINYKEFLDNAKSHIKGEDLLKSLDIIDESLTNDKHPSDFADSLRLSNGITGYINHTVPIVLYCWLKCFNNFEAGIEQIIMLGGDTDTTAAILGGIMGASLNNESIPEKWTKGIFDWPRSISHMQKVQKQLINSSINKNDTNTISLCWIGIPFRNLFFTLVILYHGVRRLF